MKCFKYEDDDFIWVWRKEGNFIQYLKFNKVTDESTGLGFFGTHNNTDPLTGEDFNIKPEAVNISKEEFEVYEQKRFEEKRRKAFEQ